MKECVLVIALMFAGTANAEVYTWIDEDGEKHFGDSVPTGQTGSASKLELEEVNVISGNDGSRGRDRVGTHNEPGNKSAVAGKTKDERPTKQGQTSENESCKAAVAEYEKSVECFNKCRNVNGSINRAKCPDCVDVPRPGCHSTVK